MSTTSRPTKPPLPAKAVQRSENRKLGNAAATYAAQQSCPKTCRLRGSSCYAETGPISFITGRLNRVNAKALEIAKVEAAEIDKLDGWLPLRLHVVGDCPTDTTAKIVAAAAMRYQAKHNSPAWGYTHSRQVDRSSWGSVSILASCETTAEAKMSMNRGYAAALITEFPGNGGKAFIKDGLKIVPCPYQTRTEEQRPITCTDCKLCFNDKRLLADGVVIGFAPHGSRARTVRETLIQISAK